MKGTSMTGGKNEMFPFIAQVRRTHCHTLKFVENKLYAENVLLSFQINPLYLIYTISRQ